MIGEVRKSFDTIVDTMTPLYGLTESQFSARFADEYRSFKAVYFEAVRSCENSLPRRAGITREAAKAPLMDGKFAAGESCLRGPGATT